MAPSPSSTVRRGKYKYGRLPQQAQHDDQHDDSNADGPPKISPSTTTRKGLFAAIVVTVALVGSLIWIYDKFSRGQKPCDGVDGYTCRPTISYFWGQYSPYFSVPSEIDAAIPHGCSFTFAQVLSRHGGRDPTEGKSILYNITIQKLKSNVDIFSGKYSFLKDYQYTLGADQLTAFGEQQMVYSGMKFYQRYNSLAKRFEPFVRASGQERVVDSAKKFLKGVSLAKSGDGTPSESYNASEILVIPEHSPSNNSLSHGHCDAFENGPASDVGPDAQTQWINIFGPKIQKRLNRDLPGANLSLVETVFMMDLCPFETIASPTGLVSPFCDLFTKEEWHQYDYFQSLGKYYGYGDGNPLGPSQGVGFTNELIARLTGKPVNDHTSTNSTLDKDPSTFPIGGGNVLFADFSHDNDMMTIYSAMGLYNSTPPLSKTSIQTTEETKGFAASWTVPFAGRIYVEKMKCSDESEELVRVLVNYRVMPLTTCGADSKGRCRLSAFVDSLSFAREGGHWDECFR